MKAKLIIKSLADLEIAGLAPEPDRPAQLNPPPIPADPKTKPERDNQSHLTVSERSGIGLYRHWGLNE